MAVVLFTWICVSPYFSYLSLCLIVWFDLLFCLIVKCLSCVCFNVCMVVCDLFVGRFVVWLLVCVCFVCFGWL